MPRCPACRPAPHEGCRERQPGGAFAHCGVALASMTRGRWRGTRPSAVRSRSTPDLYHAAATGRAHPPHAEHREARDGSVSRRHPARLTAMTRVQRRAAASLEPGESAASIRVSNARGGRTWNPHAGRPWKLREACQFRRDPADARRRLARWLRPMPPYGRRFRMTLQMAAAPPPQRRVRELPLDGRPHAQEPARCVDIRKPLHEVRPRRRDRDRQLRRWAARCTWPTMDLLDHGRASPSLDIDRTHFAVSHPRIVEVTGGQPVARGDGLCASCAGQKVLAIHDGDHGARCWPIFGAYCRPGLAGKLLRGRGRDHRPLPSG